MKSEMELPMAQGDLDFIPDVRPPTPLNASDILRSAEVRQAAPKTPLDIADRLIQIVQNPEEMQTVLDDIADPYDDHAPQVANNLRLSAANALAFLASKAPRKTHSAPGMAPIEPTTADVKRFERYLAAVNDPAGLLDDAMRGNLTSESVEAVKTVYPQIFSTIQAQIAERLSNSPNISYQRRMQLSSLLGQDMTGTRKLGLTAQSVYGTQRPQAATPQQQQQLKSFQAKALNPERQAWSDAQPKGAAARMGGQR